MFLHPLHKMYLSQKNVHEPQHEKIMSIVHNDNGHIPLKARWCGTEELLVKWHIYIPSWLSALLWNICTYLSLIDHEKQADKKIAVKTLRRALDITLSAVNLLDNFRETIQYGPQCSPAGLPQKTVQ